MKKKWDRALGLFGFTIGEIDTIYELVGLLANVGNVKIEKGVDEYSHCDIVKDEHWANVLELTGADGDTLEKFFLNKVTVIGDEINFTIQRHEDCVSKVNVFARAVYYELFEWLVMKTDISESDLGTYHTLSVIDFSGFENLKINSFEQL